MRNARTFTVLIGLLWSVPVLAQLPPPPAEWADWPTTWNADDPGEMAADALLDKPAGRRGGIVVKDGHFYSGDTRVRFWGVNLAFSANFPTHAMADQLARRFARYGINAVRFHHMDNQPFPAGIFADKHLEELSPEALDRLDYFIAALKGQGVYADLNLHVSRNYNHYHRTPDGKDGPRVDKMVDLFDPELIAAQKRYASDLLTHVNPYTKSRYADEPAVGIVEINNENSLFMWGSERGLANLDEPYAGELKRQWNAWLMKKYGYRSKLEAAWGEGSEPAGPNLLADPRGKGSPWRLEQHGESKAAASPTADGVRIDVTRVDGTGWHVQFNQSGLAVTKGQDYRVTFRVRADQPTTVDANAGQAHDPWGSFGPGRETRVDTKWRMASFGFTAPADDANARLTFHLGSKVAAVELADVDLHAGGAVGIAADEDPSTGTVATGAGDVRLRHDDWCTFLEQTEEAYYTGMRDYLHKEIGVKCPVTGTIGFGPMGTYAQRDMDYVDAHAYWQHPSFPGKSWDAKNWTIPNTAMVDAAGPATLDGLADTRVAGKPFTVTEYQHPAPNDWQAECVPLIATFAARQDWDGVFLFAYSHDANYDKGRIGSFFDIEGNPTKMPMVPMGARLFLGQAVPPCADQALRITPAQALSGAGGTDMDAFVRQILRFKIGGFWHGRSVRFGDASIEGVTEGQGERSVWTGGGGLGTGQFSLSILGVSTPIVRVGFGAVVGPTPFASLVIIPADPSKRIESAERLLVTAIARARNTDMGWNATRTSVGDQWGHAPVQIEVVHADVTVPGHWSHAWALDPAGKKTDVDVAEPGATETVLHLGRSAALGYVVVR